MHSQTMAGPFPGYKHNTRTHLYNPFCFLLYLFVSGVDDTVVVLIRQQQMFRGFWKQRNVDKEEYEFIDRWDILPLSS